MTQTKSAPNIVALGGMNMALIGTAARLPHPGETIRGERFYTAPGGKGATQAVAAARLGANVKMVGRVGRDMFGPRLLDALKNDGIDVSGVAEDPDHPSGVGMIVLNAERQNHVLAIYGANLQCNEDQLASVEDALALIHRRTACRRPSEETKGCASESGIMVLKHETHPRKGAPNRCYHATTPTASVSPSTITAWWPMPG